MKSFKILVCGGRNYNDQERIDEVLDLALLTLGHITIIHGNARGADSCADVWAKSRKIDILSYPADWGKYGKAAGFIRNKQMLDEGKPDLIIAFPGGKGTDMMCDIASKAGVPIRRYK